MSNTSVVVSISILGINVNSLSKISDRSLVVLESAAEKAAVVIGVSILGIELDNISEISDRFLINTFRISRESGKLAIVLLMGL